MTSNGCDRLYSRVLQFFDSLKEWLDEQGVPFMHPQLQGYFLSLAPIKPNLKIQLRRIPHSAGKPSVMTLNPHNFNEFLIVNFL